MSAAFVYYAESSTGRSTSHALSFFVGSSSAATASDPDRQTKPRPAHPGARGRSMADAADRNGAGVDKRSSFVVIFVVVVGCLRRLLVLRLISAPLLN